jgi:hypothetical protein
MQAVVNGSSLEINFNSRGRCGVNHTPSSALQRKSALFAALSLYASHQGLQILSYRPHLSRGWSVKTNFLAERAWTCQLKRNNLTNRTWFQTNSGDFPQRQSNRMLPTSYTKLVAKVLYGIGHLPQVTPQVRSQDGT